MTAAKTWAAAAGLNVVFQLYYSQGENCNVNTKGNAHYSPPEAVGL